MVTITPPATVFDTLLAALRSSAAYNRDDVVPPAVMLWPDEKREGERLLPRLRLALPHRLTFGPYDKDRRTGPAIWIRCALAGRIPEITWPADIIACRLADRPPDRGAHGRRGVPALASIGEGKDLTPDRFRKLLDEEGYQFLAATETGNPDGRAWTEFGNLDQTGPQRGHRPGPSHPRTAARPGRTGSSRCWRPAGRRSGSSPTTAGCSCRAGCRRSDLPKYLTATRWRRCAVVKPSAAFDYPASPGSGRTTCGSPARRDRLLHGGRGIQPRRAELAGMRRAAARRPAWRQASGFCENRVGQVGRAAVPGQGRGRFRRLHGGPAGQGRRPGDLALPGPRPVAKDGIGGAGGRGRHPRGDGDHAGPAR